ncbi:Moesin/ezrin/radixin [Trichinella pseudospiralis]
MSVKRSATIQRILDKVFSPFGITDHTIFILTYKNQILEKNTKIGKYIKEQKAILKVIPICYPPVGCEYMKNPAILAVMYNHSLQKVCNGNLTPSYEYTVKLMAIALYERHMEDIDKYRNRRTLGLPMPSWATTKYKIKEDKWKNDLIVELNKLSFSDRFQAMEEYLKVAKDANIYGQEIFYIDEEHSCFLGMDIHGVQLHKIDDEVNYFQWHQVLAIPRKDNNIILKLKAPEKRSTIVLQLPIRNNDDAYAFLSYCLTLVGLNNVESTTFNNFMIRGNSLKKYKALIEEYLTTAYLADCPLTAETTQCTDNLPMDEEHSADNNDEYESEYTSGSYIIEDENQHEYQVQEDGEEEEKDDDDDDDDEESNEEDDGFEEDEDDYIEYEKHNKYREYDNKSEILLGEEEEAGTKEKCKKQYVENNSKPREAISDLKYESTMNDQVETLYQEKLMVPFDNELSQGALQNLIIKCINEDELIKSIKHKLKFVETNLDDKYDLDVKIEITATLMSEELYKTAQDKNYAKENKDNNSEEKETAI